MRAAIIGTSFISEIHFRELSKKKFSEIFIISRNKKRARDFIKKNKEGYIGKLLIGNKKNLQDTKLDFISLCTNTKTHYKYLLLLNKVSCLIFVEKPLFSINQHTNTEKALNNIYNKNQKIATSYPMKYLAKSFIKKFKFKKKIEKLEIFYQTRGSHKFKDIADDLLPHALSLLYCLTKKTNTTLGEIKKFKSNSKENSWSSKVYYDKLFCNISFKENPKNKESIFYFKINNQKITRTTEMVDGEFISYLIFDNKRVKITNPMKDCVEDAFTNKKNLKWINNEKILTKKMILLSSILLKNKS